MKIAFSTLACPDWSLDRVLYLATTARYDGVELRFIEGQHALWKLPAFTGSGLQHTKRALADAGLTVCCVDTSCYFHWIDSDRREEAIAEGMRMAALAGELGAPGIRVFGDAVQAGADRDETLQWIAESIQVLAASTEELGVGVWLETHGDFASSDDTLRMVQHSSDTGVIWDPVNAALGASEKVDVGCARLGRAIRHVHLKDVTSMEQDAQPALPGEGVFEMCAPVRALKWIGYEAYVSFEWEKKWFADIPDAEIAVPAFAEWWRRNVQA